MRATFASDYSGLAPRPSIKTGFPEERTTTLTVPLLRDRKVATGMTCFLAIELRARLTFFRRTPFKYTPTVPQPRHFVATSAICFAPTPVRTRAAPFAEAIE